MAEWFGACFPSCCLHFNLEEAGRIVALYPIIWGLGQLFTGKLAGHLDKRRMLFRGMLLQGLVLLLRMAYGATFGQFVALLPGTGLESAAYFPVGWCA